MRILYVAMRKSVNRPERRFTRLEATALGARLRNCADASDTTGVELAETLGSSQSRISRIFDGQFARESTLVKALCAYLRVDAAATPPPAPTLTQLPTPLRRALETAWDGSDQGARALAALLTAAIQVRSTAPAPRPALRNSRPTSRRKRGTSRD